MFIILLVISLLIPSPTHGSSASASATSHKRKVPGLDEEADVKMRDVGENNDDASKKQKRDSESTAPTSAAMEIDLKEEAHDLPYFNPHGEAHLFQICNHYHLFSNDRYTQQHNMGRALYALRAAIDEGANVDTVDGDGMTVLHHATVSRLPQVIFLLLGRNANVHVPRCVNTSTVLHSAVGGAPSEPDDYNKGPVHNDFYEYRGLDKHALALFANRGFDFNRRDFDDLTPLLASLAYWGRPYHIKFLISQGARVSTLARGRGALSILFNRKGRYIHASDLLDITKLLVTAGTDFQRPSPEGRSPLYEAWLLRSNSAQSNDEKAYAGDVISWLIGIGAQVKVPNNEIFSVEHLFAGLGERYETDEEGKQSDRLWEAVRNTTPKLLAPLDPQPAPGTPNATCLHLIFSYLATHPLIEEGYRQRRLFNRLQNKRFVCLTLCLNKRKPGLHDVVPIINRFAGPLYVEHYPEAEAKRAHAAQVVPMDEGK